MAFINYKSKTPISEQRAMYKRRLHQGGKQQFSKAIHNGVLSWDKALKATKPDLEIVKQVKEVEYNPLYPIKFVKKRHFLTQKYIKRANEKVIYPDLYPKWISRVND